MAEDQESDNDNRGRISKHVGWWIGVIAGLAGIAGLIFTISTREQFTVKEWRQQANAACNNVNTDLLDKWARATTAVYTLEEGGYQSADYQTAAFAWQAVGKTEEKLTSEIGKIEMPNSHEEDISRLLEDLNAASYADAMLAVDLGKEVFTGDSKDAKDRHNGPAVKVQQGFRKLDVSHCSGLPPSG
ncbi:hypothetical protein ACFYNL_16445 [Streptomyces sp. NPDC007808]|uniref:hypothetical protein n=1 Tax=Streptomyces sp. NPDC007808 TaxID=3364779 RepID=UPI0036B5777D